MRLFAPGLLHRAQIWLVSMLASASVTAVSQTIAWPTDTKLGGNAFLSPGLLKLQADSANSPVTLWLDRGSAAWANTSSGLSCQSCHGAVDTLKASAPSFPRLTINGQTLINLEDQIVACMNRNRRHGQPGIKLEDDDVLALSTLLHDAAKGMAINVKAPPDHAAQWQARLESGTQLFARRIGRMNLACVHCHDQNVGKQMRADVISPGNPTGFPIYRMSWQKMGSVDRRLRACYSGVQAVIPPSGDPALRDLELYLKVRANGMPLDGPSIRR